MADIWNGEAVILRQERLAPSCLEMTLEVPRGEPVAAGQFCHLRIERTSDPLLRRPFSYWDVTHPRKGISHAILVYAVVGKATEILARRQPGSRVGYLGPLGNGFDPKPARTLVFVAGGVGIVPFYHMARQALARKPKPRILLLFGGRTESHLYGIDEFPPLGVKVHAATEDGSRGTKGLVTDLLEKELPGLDRTGLRLCVCGPEKMTEAVVRIARREALPCEVSLERRMGCALGACGACVTRVTGDDGAGWRYSRACCEGPVYDASRLVLS
jgi:dihydroorotate dehydrogenase electron transfer subunit